MNPGKSGTKKKQDTARQQAKQQLEGKGKGKIQALSRSMLPLYVPPPAWKGHAKAARGIWKAVVAGKKAAKGVHG